MLDNNKTGTTGRNITILKRMLLFSFVFIVLSISTLHAESRKSLVNRYKSMDDKRAKIELKYYEVSSNKILPLKIDEYTTFINISSYVYSGKRVLENTYEISNNGLRNYDVSDIKFRIINNLKESICTSTSFELTNALGTNYTFIYIDERKNEIFRYKAKFSKKYCKEIFEYAADLMMKSFVENMKKSHQEDMGAK
jgi:hypothetical protein